MDPELKTALEKLDAELDRLETAVGLSLKVRGQENARVARRLDQVIRQIETVLEA